MKRLGIMLMIVVLMFGGLFAFGSVNQFEIETGLTVDALMFPMEKTAEAMGCNSVNMTYMESAIVNYNSMFKFETVVVVMPYYFFGMPLTEVNLGSLGGVTDRLKYPFSI